MIEWNWVTYSIPWFFFFFACNKYNRYKYDIDKLWSSRDSAYKQIAQEVQHRVREAKLLRRRVYLLERELNLLRKNVDKSSNSV